MAGGAPSELRPQEELNAQDRPGDGLHVGLQRQRREAVNAVTDLAAGSRVPQPAACRYTGATSNVSARPARSSGGRGEGGGEGGGGNKTMRAFLPSADRRTFYPTAVISLRVIRTCWKNTQMCRIVGTDTISPTTTFTTPFTFAISPVSLFPFYQGAACNGFGARGM